MTIPNDERPMHSLVVTTERPTVDEACHDLHAYIVASAPPLSEGVRLLACLDVLAEAAREEVKADGEPSTSS